MFAIYGKVDYLSTGERQKSVSVYIDGFNLYHAIAVLGDSRLKWLNFMSLSKSFLRPGEELKSIYFFTAVVTWDADKQKRHRNFIAAQRAMGVTIVESNFKAASKFCEPQQRYCKRHEEKQTDVAFATTLMADAIEGHLNRAILVTADSDQVPLARQMKRLFPHIQMTLSAPPDRSKHARDLGNEITDRVPLELKRLYANCLPREVLDARGRVVARMPTVYEVAGATSLVSGAPDPTENV